MVIVKSRIPVTLVGGAQVNPADLETALRHAPRLVAIDGGADRVMALGQRPEAVIGDMDSITDLAASVYADVMHPVPEQESTDFDKALRHVAAPLVIALGVSGGRMDHGLAALHGILARPERICLIYGDEGCAFVCPPHLRLDLEVGCPLSLFPFGPVGVVSEGLRWPTAGLPFEPRRKIGTSNEVTGPVTLKADGPDMVVILPQGALGACVRALLAPDVGIWPARDQ